MVIIGINPYVYMGNWGLYHRKVCKATTGTNTPSTLGKCSGTIVATLTAEISSATLSTTSSNNLTLNLKTEDAKIDIEGDSSTTGSSNGAYHLASAAGSLSVNSITLNGTSSSYTLNGIGSLAANLQLQSGTTKNSVTIKRDTLITLKLKNPDPGATLTVDSSPSTQGTLKGPKFGPLSLGAYKVNKDVPLKTSEAQSINTDTSTESELHSNHSDKCCIWGKQYEWTSNPMAWYWNMFTILAPLKICLAVTFIYSLHYRESSLSRAIINQPKMSTALSIIFYLCHRSH